VLSIDELGGDQATTRKLKHYGDVQWTRTRNWTAALLVFKIHFQDRLPD
jgi:hypothetical protein